MFDKIEAAKILDHELAAVGGSGYAELTNSIGRPPLTKAVRAPSGRTYQVEIEVLWDAGGPGAIRVLGAVSGSGWSDFRPLCRDLLIPVPEPKA